jgi:glycosyltransferase involved in cell wall biosynthesis
MSSSRLRLAVIDGTAPMEATSTARILERMLAGLDRRGIAVARVRGDDGEPVDIADPGARAAFVAQRADRQAGQCTEAFARFGAEAVYIEFAGPFGHAALAAAEQRGLPVASAFHHLHEYVEPARREEAIELLCGFHRRCRRTFAEHPEGERLLRARGVPGVVRVDRGVDTRGFAPERRSARLRAAWGADDHAPVALSVGRLVEQKNPALLVRALAAARAAHPDLRAVVAGDGPLRERLREQLPWAVFTGQLGPDTLATVYASADLLLFPSRTDSYGLVVPEAMAAGLPVVAFGRAAAQLLIHDGVDGVLATDDDGLVAAAVSLAGDAPLRRRLGAAARLTAEGLSWERAADRFAAELLAMAAGTPG